jgi:hypothetical protein
MANGERKVSLMTHLTDVPGDAKIYVVVPGDTTPYYTTKDELLAGAGSTPHNAKVQYGGVPITVPAGFIGIVTNLNTIYSNVEYTVTGTELTITGGADTGELLLINGKY